MQSHLAREGGSVIWFFRTQVPAVYGLDASVVAAGLTALSDEAVLAELKLEQDGTVHGLRLIGTPSKVDEIALGLRERAARDGVTAMIRPWPEYAADWTSSAAP